MRRRAFTLVEILVGCALLGLFMVVVYMMFRDTTRNFNTRGWRMGAQPKLRNVLNLLRRKLEAASYPSRMTPQSVVVDESEEYMCRVAPSTAPGGGGDEEGSLAVFRYGAAEGGGRPEDVDFLVFYCCKPGRCGFPAGEGEEDTPVVCERVTLSLRDAYEIKGAKGARRWLQKLVMNVERGEIPADSYSRGDSFSFSRVDGYPRVLCEDVNEVILRVSSPVSDYSGAEDAMEGRPMELRIRLVCPYQGQVNITDRLKAIPGAGIALP